MEEESPPSHDQAANGGSQWQAEGRRETAFGKESPGTLQRLGFLFQALCSKGHAYTFILEVR